MGQHSQSTLKLKVLPLMSSLDSIGNIPETTLRYCDAAIQDYGVSGE